MKLKCNDADIEAPWFIGISIDESFDQSFLRHTNYAVTWVLVGDGYFGYHELPWCIFKEQI